MKPNRLTFAVTLAVAALPLATAAKAQIFLTSDSFTADGTTPFNETVRVGMDSTLNQFDSGGNPYVANLNVATGSELYEVYNYNTSTTNVVGGTVRERLYAYDNSTTTVSAGNVASWFVFGTSINTITSGTVGGISAGESSTTFIQGGTINGIGSYGTNVVNISGGTITNANGFDGTTYNISGGTIENGLFFFNAAPTVNFIGTGFVTDYLGYSDSNPYGESADNFQITGFFGGVSQTYDLFIRNTTGSGDATARQFNLVSVVVPEAGTLTLVLPALGVLGAVVAKRRRFNK